MQPTPLKSSFSTLPDSLLTSFLKNVYCLKNKHFFFSIELLPKGIWKRMRLHPIMWWFISLRDYFIWKKKLEHFLKRNPWFVHITLVRKIPPAPAANALLLTHHTNPSAFIFVMVFVPSRLQHIAFGLLSLFNLIIGKSPKPKRCANAQYKNLRQK